MQRQKFDGPRSNSFRLFDIFKPPPIRQLERLPAGTGIMLDDVAAGLFALARKEVRAAPALLTALPREAA